MADAAAHHPQGVRVPRAPAEVPLGIATQELIMARLELRMHHLPRTRDLHKAVTAGAELAVGLVKSVSLMKVDEALVRGAKSATRLALDVGYRALTARSFGVPVQGADLEVDREQNAALFYFRGGYNNDVSMFAGGTTVDKKLALFERGELKAGDVLHFVVRGAVLEVALNDSPFEEVFTELPAGVVPLAQFGYAGNVVELRALHLAAKNGLHEAARQHATGGGRGAWACQ
ncbi:hypothetical protein CYMTET_46234 [Cymbomonas tetramitiformis]|uniref:Uncharacterized protein n=1 Tax=Cymbomonas tetramitiformis TaxID=36881 RepID=A0AAE0BYF7_9CHLO|nr:hypothetical protein CYMTET_46234 [Cymbomonas tetramitiformis]